MITLARLSGRLQRFELVSVLIIVALLAAAALIVRGHLVGLNVPTSCFAEFLTSGPRPGSSCGAAAQEFFSIENREAIPVMQAMALAPLIAGILLGVGLVGREIEAETAGLVWALDGSRVRWLAGRLLPIGVALIALLGILAVASDLLMAAREPWVDSGKTLVDMDAHGGLLVLRGAVAFLIAALVGAALGRTLPSIIVATALVAVVGAVGIGLSNVWLEANIEYRPEPVDAVNLPGGLNFGTMSRGKDGMVIPDHAALSLAPPDADPSAWVADNYENVYAFVPGSAYPEYVSLQAVVLAVGLVVQVAVLLAVVRRRRPRN